MYVEASQILLPVVCKSIRGGGGECIFKNIFIVIHQNYALTCIKPKYSYIYIYLIAYHRYAKLWKGKSCNTKQKPIENMKIKYLKIYFMIDHLFFFITFA